MVWNYRSLFGPFFWPIPILLLHPPPLECSFARYFGRENGHTLLICSSRSTTKTSFLFVRSVRSQELTNCCSLPLHHTFASTNPGEWPQQWLLGWQIPQWMDMDHGCLWCKIAPKESKRSATSHIQTIIDHQSTALCDVFFFSNPCYHPLRHGMHRRDRNLGIFLITQVITICCWIDSLRGPNIPQWNRQENSACYIYIFDDWHHIGLGYHHWNSSTLSSHGMLIGKCLEHVDRDFARAWWQRITEIISITWKYKCSFITKSFA